METTATERAIDLRLAALESPDPAAKANPFSRLLERARLRTTYEGIAAAYLSLLGQGGGSPQLSLKILHVLDIMRARDVALQAVRVAPIGPRRRQPWSGLAMGGWCSAFSPGGGEARSLRMMRSANMPFPSTFNPPPQPDAVDFVRHDASGTAILDLPDVLILHLGFVNDGLVIALDSNLEVFFYGRESVATDRRVRSGAFRDYSYDVDGLEPDRVIFGPVLRPQVRHKLVQLGEQLHARLGEDPTYPNSGFFRSVMAEMDELVGYQELVGVLRRWALSRKRSLEDICLVMLPDEALFLLPLSFLGASQGEPLATSLGGVTVGLSLIALKWAAMDYHWTTLPNLSIEAPRCTLFAIQGSRPLNLWAEIEAVSAAFGTKDSMVLSEASRAEFSMRYSAGDVCWFAGHGLYDLSHGIQAGSGVLPFPLVGPEFSDGPLTNWDLIATSNWNFKSLWLTVMNSCLLARSFLVGPNPLGYVSALHTVGSVASVAALWPVRDDAAIDFASNMAREIVANFRRTDFPRARAFSTAVRKAVDGNPERLWLFAPYTLWGLP